ncbi:hypothetical protein BGW41_000106 [Actinomortierella wolfii]|nr:hypothetical protein BGW41_000106 [Actinomortierella wolfii]
MTDKHQLKADSESLNSSDIQGTTVAETLESALSKLSLDKASNSSVAPPDQDDASSELASQGARANGFSTLQTTSVVLQQPSEHTKEQKVEKDGDSAQSNPATASENELSPKDLALKKLGLKATHRPGFYLYEDNPQRMRIQTSTHAFDLDRRCPHAKADMLKWV